MSNNAQDELRIAKEAAQWLDELREKRSLGSPAFAQWLVTSPLHVKAFLNVTAVERLLDRVDPTHQIDVEGLLADASNVQALPQRIDISAQAHALLARGRKRRRWLAAGVAVAASAAISVWLWPFSGQTFVTAVGEQRTLELEDGSIVNLNTRSQVKVLFSANERQLLLDGEAMFKVAPDPARPFRVHSGNAVIQAIGTQFNVHRRPSGTVVSVIEGSVQVSGAATVNVLKSGEEAKVSRSGGVEKRAIAQAMDAAAWRQQRLVFSDDRLDDIVAEFNRWNREQIRIEGEAVAARLYSGAFDADDPESLIAFLSRDPVLLIEERGRELTIRPKG